MRPRKGQGGGFGHGRDAEGARKEEGEIGEGIGEMRERRWRGGKVAAF